MSRITNDVNLVQQAVSETIGDLLREGLSLFGYAALLFCGIARLALVCVTGAPIVVYPLVRLGQRVRRSTRRSQEARASLAHRPPKRSPAIASSRPSAPRSTRSERFGAPRSCLYRTNLKVTSTRRDAAAADGASRRAGGGRPDLVRQPADRAGAD